VKGNTGLQVTSTMAGRDKQYVSNHLIGIGNNKTLDLSTLKVRSRLREDFMFHACDMSFNDNTNIDNIDRLLKRLCGYRRFDAGNQKSQNAYKNLKQVLGLMILSNPDYSYPILITGPTKSTKLLCGLIHACLGKLAQMANVGMLHTDNRDQVDVILRERRVVIFMDVDHNTIVPNNVLKYSLHKSISRNSNMMTSNNMSIIFENSVTSTPPTCDAEFYHIELSDITDKEISQLYVGDSYDSSLLNELFFLCAKTAHLIHNNKCPVTVRPVSGADLILKYKITHPVSKQMSKVQFALLLDGMVELFVKHNNNINYNNMPLGMIKRNFMDSIIKLHGQHEYTKLLCQTTDLEFATRLFLHLQHRKD